jgi:tol-pal system protein YbgF
MLTGLLGVAAAGLMASSTTAVSGPVPLHPAGHETSVVHIQAQPRKATSAQKSAPRDDQGAGRSGDPQLRQRVDQLEEQLTDMQVTVGTLESLGRGTSGGTAPQGRASTGGGVDQARLDSLETQIRALTSQIEQLAEQVRQLSSGRRSDAAPIYQPPGVAPPHAQAPGGRFAAGAQPTPTPGPGAYHSGVPQADPARAQPGFGQLTVSPNSGGNDPIGNLIAPEPAGANANTSPSPLPAGAANASTAKELYETAYGYLLQQDYGASEVAFEEFLRRYPSDRLAPDAQYWLGEALYVQRRYKPAGQAFLGVIQKHPNSAKVPSSMLKLAMTLEQLGTKDCALFIELETRQPNATPDIKAKARTVKQRVGC